jgi:hypothetical protein
MMNHLPGVTTMGRRSGSIAIVAICAATAGTAQDRGPQPQSPPSVDAGWARYQDTRQGPEQTERVSRTIRLSSDTWLDLANSSGDIDLSVGAGRDIVIDAIKRARGRDGRARDLLASVSVDIVERPGRVEVRTLYPRGEGRGSVWVDYTVRVPASTSVNLKSVSGDIRVTNLKGELRLESVSGDVSVGHAGRLSFVRSVSGDVMLTDVTSGEDLSAGSVSGTFVARGLDARILDINTVSGDLVLERVRCERAQIRSVSGTVEYVGSLTERGRYEFNSHSGDVRLGVTPGVGFEYEASTFSGALNADWPTPTVGRETDAPGRRRDARSIRGTVGNGSALLLIRTFSGDVSIGPR